MDLRLGIDLQGDDDALGIGIVNGDIINMADVDAVVAHDGALAQTCHRAGEVGAEIGVFLAVLGTRDP